MNIGIATDHRGTIIKEELMKFLKDYNVIDYSEDSKEGDDYPIYAFRIGEAIKDGKIDFGILLCGTGIGMSIACNKVKSVRCAKVDNVEEAKLTRIDNNSNVIALSSKKSIKELEEIIITFLNEPFTNIERHSRRIGLIDNYEC